MKEIFIASITLLTLLAAIVIFSIKTNAQSAGGLDITVSPPVIELNVKPGDKIKEKFRIRNNLSQSVNLSVSTLKLVANSTNGEPVPANPGPDDEFISWVTFDSPNFNALPKEWIDVSFTIEIPQSAAFGYYYVFRIAEKSDQQFKGVGAEVKGEILIPTLLNVKKEGVKTEAQVLEFKTNSFISEYLPVEFTARIANKGNVHIRPRGNIFIRGTNQKEIGILEINPTQISVLPDGTRSFSASWNDGFLVKEPVMEDNKVKVDAKGNPITHIVVNWNKFTSFRFGPYTASLLMVFDDGKRDVTLEGSTKFWIIPYGPLILIGISLIALFIIVKFVLKGYIRRELKRQKNLR